MQKRMIAALLFCFISFVIHAETVKTTYTSITKAIARKDMEDVKRHIKNGVDINRQNSSGWAPLHYTAVRGYPQIAGVLLDNGARVNLKTKSGKSALLFAAERNFIDMAKLLIQKGADISPGDNEGWSPLHYAAVKGHNDMIKLLLDAGAKINMQSKGGGTPLHEASASSGPDTINLLLSNGADSSIKAYNGKTALDYAIELENNEAVGILRLKTKPSPSGNKPIRVLLTYGGHGFKKEHFFKMFDNLPGVKYTKHDLVKNPSVLKPGLEKDYDVIVMYDMIRKPFTDEQKQNFLKLLNNGIGIVALHHNLCGHNSWDEYRKIIGGKYIRKEEKIDGRKYSPSGFSHDEDVNVIIVDKEHPITKGLKDFTIHDETYGKCYVASEARILMKTGHPKCNPEIAWTLRYGNSPVFYLLLGHDDKAWNHPAYPELLLRGIKWANQ